MSNKTKCDDRWNTSNYSHQYVIDHDTEDRPAWWSSDNYDKYDVDSLVVQSDSNQHNTCSSSFNPVMIRTDGGRDSEESEMMSEERGNKNQAETVSETETVESIGIIEAQECAKTAAEELFEHDFKSVIKVEADDNNEWRTVIELVERRAVPDTQDIIGRYEINLTSTGNVAGYELVERYQRGDMKEEL
jgi:hypothetical protein